MTFLSFMDGYPGDPTATATASIRCASMHANGERFAGSLTQDKVA
jgi:hypothetical protein